MSKLLINISSKLFISLVLCCNFASFSKQRTCTLVSVCSKSSQTLLKLTHFSRLILWKHFLHSLFCVFNSSHSLVGIDTTFSQYFWEHWLTEVQCFSRRVGIVWMCHSICSGFSNQFRHCVSVSLDLQVFQSSLGFLWKITEPVGLSVSER